VRQHREGAPIVRIREGKNPRPVAVRRLAAKKRVPAEDSGAANGGPHAVQAVPIDDFYGRTDLDLHSRCYARQGALWPSCRESNTLSSILVLHTISVRCISNQRPVLQAASKTHLPKETLQ